MWLFELVEVVQAKEATAVPTLQNLCTALNILLTPAPIQSRTLRP